MTEPRTPDDASALTDCLPPNLRDAGITRIAAGLSGAGVYRVEAGGATYVLKVAAGGEPVERWRWKLAVQRAAGDAGVAPRVVHHVEHRRAIVSEHVVDHSFPAMFATPATRDAALALLARTLRAVHDLPLPPGTPEVDAIGARGVLETEAAAAPPGFLPVFVRDAAARLLAETPPPRDRPIALSHNDVNPTNLALDGERLVLLDWDTAGPNDPLHDLATIAVFLRMDDATSLALVAAHDAAPLATLPPRFAYLRRVVAVACGILFARLARELGHAGAARGGSDDAASGPTLGDVYAKMRSGAFDVRSADGQWQMALALVRAAL